MGDRADVLRPPMEALCARALRFDLQAELDLCIRLATEGGPAGVKAVFDTPRATRLFQGLLWTGRFQAMDDHWRVSVQTGIDRGVLAKPEWN